MAEGFRGIIHKYLEGTYDVQNKENEYLGCIVWHEEWNCYRFHPKKHTAFGPAFLAWLTTEIIVLEAKKRRDA